MEKVSIPWEQTVEWARVVAGCIIRKDDKYLMVQEKQPRAYGLWNLPAGHVDKGETIESAAVRETKEETGFIVELEDKVGIYHEDAQRPVKHAFRARIVGGKKNATSNEILDVAWLAFEEIQALHEADKIRSPWIWEAICEVERNSGRA